MMSVWRTLALVSALGSCDGGSSAGAEAGMDASEAGIPERDGGIPETATYESFEGQYCSRASDEDPQYRCSTAYDLICITTFAQRRPGDAAAEPIYLCRLACTPGGPACLVASDVCCAGTTPDGGQRHVCVPRQVCENRDGGP